VSACREGICGSCAMNIDGVNGLACLTKVGSLVRLPSVSRPHCAQPNTQQPEAHMTASRRSATTAQPQRSGGVYRLLARQQNPPHTPTGFRRRHAQYDSDELAAADGACSEQGDQSSCS
jgi:2Fe-2S iron-sulfur cluster binding domain